MKVVVEDVNDHAPTFLAPFYEGRLPENQPSFPEPFRVQAIDGDLNGETMN